MSSLAENPRLQRLDVILWPAQKSEARRLAELFRMSAAGIADYVWQGLAARGESILDVGTRRFARDSKGSSLSYRNCLMAEYDGKPIGMMQIYPVATDSSQAAEPETDPVLRPYRELELPNSLFLSCYAVDPDYRRQGLGSQLLEVAKDIAPWHEVGQISALAIEDNKESLRLLQRYGFAEVARRRIVPHPLIRARGDVILLAASA